MRRPGQAVPRGGGFSLCTRRDIRKLEEDINGIHRLSLGGKTAAQFDTELARAAEENRKMNVKANRPSTTTKGKHQ